MRNRIGIDPTKIKSEPIQLLPQNDNIKCQFILIFSKIT